MGSPSKKAAGSPSKKAGKQNRRPWGSMPRDVLVRILSVHKSDFLYRLATMGVCKHWRDCSRFVDAVVQQSSSNKGKKQQLLALGRLLEASERISILSVSLGKDVLMAFSNMVITPNLRVLELKELQLSISDLEEVVALAVGLEVLILEKIPTPRSELIYDDNRVYWNTPKLRAPKLTHVKIVSHVGVDMDAPNLRVAILLNAGFFTTQGHKLQKVRLDGGYFILDDYSNLEVLEFEGYRWTMSDVKQVIRDLPSLKSLTIKRQLQGPCIGFFHGFGARLTKLGLSTEFLKPIHVLRNQWDDCFQQLRLDEVVLHMRKLVPRASYLEHLCYFLHRCSSVARLTITDYEHLDHAGDAMATILDIRNKLGMTWATEVCIRAEDNGVLGDFRGAVSPLPLASP